MKLKHILLSFLIATTFLNCSKKNDDDQNGNPNIPNVYVDTGSQINTALGGAQGDLQFVNNPVEFSNHGINGIVVVNTGNNNFSAFELSDPNHAITTCSKLTLDGVVATCDCDDGNSYNILSGGLPESGTTGQYTLVRYQVEVSGTIIRVYNN